MASIFNKLTEEDPFLKFDKELRSKIDKLLQFREYFNAVKNQFEIDKESQDPNIKYSEYVKTEDAYRKIENEVL